MAKSIEPAVASSQEERKREDVEDKIYPSRIYLRDLLSPVAHW